MATDNVEMGVAEANSNLEQLEKDRVVANLDDPTIVTFAVPYDRENPRDWPLMSKWIVTGSLSVTGFNRIMVSTIMAPALSPIAADLQMTYIESVMALSVFLLATAFGPLLLGPLSEIYGRKTVLHATNIWFLIWNIACGFANSKALLIASRFLAGFGASAIYSLGSGVLGDLWKPEQRGRSLGLYLLVPLFGAAVGPILGGFIVEGTTWRWIFWSTSILQAVMVFTTIFTFRETYAPLILRRRAAHFRKLTNVQTYCRGATGTKPFCMWILQNSLSRPIRLLMFHPIIQVQAILAGFNYGMLYLVLSTFSDLWTRQYGEKVSISGLHYIALCLGELFGAETGGPLMDFIYLRCIRRDNRSEVGRPEFRVPIMIPAIILTAVGLCVYGWAAEYRLEWIIVDVGATIFSMAMQIYGQALQAYVIDAYPDHTASASAATQLLRSLAAFGFPLFAPKMYEVLGYGWANTMLALTFIVFGIPSSILLWVYGPKLRAKVASSF